MKTITYIFTLSLLALASCTSTKGADNQGVLDYSWSAFCMVHGYNVNETSVEVQNEYLDGWCGSAEEEKALIAAGYKPY